MITNINLCLVCCQEVQMLTQEVNARLNKLDALIATLQADKQIIEGKMFDCASILKKLEIGIHDQTGVYLKLIQRARSKRGPHK